MSTFSPSSPRSFSQLTKRHELSLFGMMACIAAAKYTVIPSDDKRIYLPESLRVVIETRVLTVIRTQTTSQDSTPNSAPRRADGGFSPSLFLRKTTEMRDTRGIAIDCFAGSFNLLDTAVNCPYTYLMRQLAQTTSHSAMQ